jgi:bacteriorhodopsin
MMNNDTKRSGGHGFMMIACCIPMLVIAIVLVATGAVSPSFLLYAVGCTAMMALMMRGMHGARDDASEVHSRR